MHDSQRVERIRVSPDIAEAFRSSTVLIARGITPEPVLAEFVLAHAKVRSAVLVAKDDRVKQAAGALSLPLFKELPKRVEELGLEGAVELFPFAPYGVLVVHGVIEPLVVPWIDALVKLVEARHRERAAYDLIKAKRATALREGKLQSAFMATMSHELRTPLNAVIGFTRIVKRKTDGQIPARQTANLEKVETSAARLLALINAMLEITRIKAGSVEVERRRFDPRELAENIARDMAPRFAAANLVIEVTGDREPISTDPNRVRQILEEVLTNALKFTEEGRVDIAVTSSLRDVEFVIRDTGVGVMRERLPAVFQAFQQADGTSTRKAGGTGIGLALVRAVAELLGGSVELESEMGAGTTVRVRVPREYQRARTTAI